MTALINRMAGKKKQVIEEPKKLWPSNLNPCPTPEEHLHVAPLWGVGGRVTKLCCACVYEKAAQLCGLSVQEWRKKLCTIDPGWDSKIYEALDTFIPDPSGNPCKA